MTTTEPYTTGSKWTGYRDAAEIAKDIRAEIKLSKKIGILIPADLKVSVTISRFAGGQAIDCRLSGWDCERVWEDGVKYGRLTEEAKQARDAVERIRESYNRDASDSSIDYFDVTYYGDTSWKV